MTGVSQRTPPRPKRLRLQLARTPPPKKGKSPWLWIFAFALLVAALVFQSLSVTLPSPGGAPCLYSNQSRHDLQMILFQAIRQARSSIHLVMFGLTDLPLIQALEERAREGIAVDIFYEKEASSPLSTLIPHAQTHPVKAKGLMHQKILIVDRETVFIGSANMTPSSLRMHDNLIVAFRHPKAADFLISHTPRSAGSYHARIGGQPLDIWLLPDPRGHAIEALRALLRSAHKTIQIALFTFTHSSLVDELIAAKKRGVHVSVLFDMHAGLGSSGRTLETLRKAGIQILTSRGPQLMHHKFLYVDGHTLLTGSANWTQAAFSKNSDCFVILRHLTPEQKTFVDRLWQKMELLSKEIVPNRS